MAERSLIYLSASSSESWLAAELKSSLLNDAKLAPRVWDWTQVSPGDRFDQVALSKLAETRVMLVLVSPRYLSSECKAWESELPYAFAAADEKALRIAWVMAERANISGTAFENINAALPIDTALTEMNAAQRAQAFEALKRTLRKLFEDDTRIFDVFASFNSEDREQVDVVVSRLENYGVKVWLDSRELPPGAPYRQRLEAALNAVPGIAVFIGPAGAGPWQQEETSAALEAAVRRGRPVIPVLLKGSKLPEESFLRNRTFVDLRRGTDDEAIRKLVWGITGRQLPSQQELDILTRAPTRGDLSGAGSPAAPRRPNYHAFGLFTATEELAFERFARLVVNYAAAKEHKRPLSVAVFGAPGSGKSRLVRELPRLFSISSLAPLVEINLTQVCNREELGATLARAIEGSGRQIPFVFFDEFDASSNGNAPWGWLDWFLAPMQDGAFRASSVRIDLRSAVFVFAGGTASRFEDFGRGSPSVFRAAKGPDFVSRLRGTLDIPGINAQPERGMRRATALRHQLDAAGKEIEEQLRDALLNVGRYTHGARSMEALVELLPEGMATLSDVRGSGLVRLHVDRGPFAPDVVGGCVGLSVGTDRDTNSEMGDVWQELTRALFADGACVAYGGNLRGNLTSQLGAVVSDLRQALFSDDETWIVVSPGVGSDPDDPLGAHGVEHLERPPISDLQIPAALAEAATRRWRGALDLFRTRYRLALRCVARCSVGGRLDAKLNERTKRLPGVAEEIMLALALRQPVYVIGGYGGSSHWAGTLLGLGSEWTGSPSLAAIPELEIPPEFESCFRPPGLPHLPLSSHDLRDFFLNHALEGPNWPNNGLSRTENRELFACREPRRITDLVTRGLRTRFIGSGR